MWPDGRYFRKVRENRFETSGEYFKHILIFNKKYYLLFNSKKIDFLKISNPPNP